MNIQNEKVDIDSVKLTFSMLELESLNLLMKYTSGLAFDFNISLENIFFGGTEKEILDRDTNWCFDLSRLAAVILDCIGLTSRFVFVVGLYK